MEEPEAGVDFSSLRARFEKLATAPEKTSAPTPSPKPRSLSSASRNGLASSSISPVSVSEADEAAGRVEEGPLEPAFAQSTSKSIPPRPTSRRPSSSAVPPRQDRVETEQDNKGRSNENGLTAAPTQRLGRSASRSSTSSLALTAAENPPLSPVLASPVTPEAGDSNSPSPTPSGPPRIPIATRPSLPSAPNSRKAPPPVPASRKTPRPASPVPSLPSKQIDAPEPSASVKSLASRFTSPPPVPASRPSTAPNTPPHTPSLTSSRNGSMSSVASTAVGDDGDVPRASSPTRMEEATPSVLKARPVIPPRPALNVQPEISSRTSVPPPPVPSRAATSPPTSTMPLPSITAPSMLARTPSNPGLSASPETFLPPPPRKLPPPLSKQPSLSRSALPPKAVPPRPVPVAAAPSPPPAIDSAPYVPPPPPSRSLAATERLAPRRPTISTPGGSGDEGSSDDDEEDSTKVQQETFPDATFANRRPPLLRNRKPIHSSGHIHSFAVRGARVVTGQHAVHVWHPSHYSGACETISLPGGDHKVTAIEFRAAGADHVADDGRYAWAGTKDGHLFEVDTVELCVVSSRLNIHLSPVVGVYRVGRSMVTVEESGKVLIWGTCDSQEAAQLAGAFKSQRVPDKQNFVAMIGDELWTSSGPVTKHGSSAVSMRSPQIRVFDPAGRQAFSPLPRPLTTPESAGIVGAVTASAIVPSQDHLIYLGHDNGFVSVWDRSTYACLLVQRVSPFMITSLVGVGKSLWAGARTGMIYVYDVRSEPWTVSKAWKAHKETVLRIVVDPASLWTDETLQVASLGTDMMIHLWDGLLRDDWLDTELNLRQPDFCTFRSIRTLCVSWNIDASKPQDLAGTPQNLDFLRDVLLSVDSPDIIAFGFQEMINLEDKKLTAKSMLLGKKKGDAKFSDGISSSYRLWHDKLVQAVRLNMPPECPYTVVHVGDMIGLFSCIFVKTSESASLRDVAKISVKTGMGGRHGNKGGILARFVIDDTSICFINCHLAAGQSHRRQRDRDLVDILEDKAAFSGLASSSPGAYAPGGDGTTVFDHELCILGGDLNYRIDARRENVVAAVATGTYESLLPHDQLLKGLATNQTFRLRSFKEPAITFAPTYKYDPHTDDYDSSAKKRIPAWCDRLLYRADRDDKITPLPAQYRRWEVNISDHRPISSAFDMQVKSIVAPKRAAVWDEVEAAWFGVESAMLAEARDWYGGR